MLTPVGLSLPFVHTFSFVLSGVGSGTIPALVKLLSSAAARTQEHAAAAVRNIGAGKRIARQQAVDSGTMPALEKLLSAPSAPGTQEYAAAAIRIICAGIPGQRQAAGN